MRNRPLAKPDESLAGLRVERRQNTLRLVPTGEWNVGQSPRLDDLLHQSNFQGAREAEIDGDGITELDSAGAWLLLRTKRELERQGARVQKFTLPQHYMPLVQTMEQDHIAPPVTHAPHEHGFVHLLENVGRGTMHALNQGYA